MKRGTIEHPKTDALTEVLLERCVMPLELARDAAIGLEERLFHFTARYAPQGDIGKHSDITIASRSGWPWEPDRCIATLLKIGWLDASNAVREHYGLPALESPTIPEDGPRLVVHDWPEHADDTARKALEREDLTFWDGTASRRTKPGRRLTGDRGRVATRSRRKRDGVVLPSLSEPSLSEPSLSETDEVEPGASTLPHEALCCVDLLNESIEQSMPGAPLALTPGKRRDWAVEIERLHRIGAPGTNHGWPWAGIVQVLEWLPTHVGSGDFRWGQQIRSAATLRKQFPRLHAEMQKSTPSGARAERAQGALEILRSRRAVSGLQRRAVV